jgi:carbon-monoxide dehydrogenase small subunit
VSHPLSLTVNGEPSTVEIDPDDSLLRVLRERLQLTGTKEGCDEGECGACTVLVDGRAVDSCLVLAATAAGRSVTTIEGLTPPGGQLHPVQAAFVSGNGAQCGICTPGMIMSAVALLAVNPSPTETDVREAIAGNLCRCTGYTTIVQSILDAARTMEAAR